MFSGVASGWTFPPEGAPSWDRCRSVEFWGKLCRSIAISPSVGLLQLPTIFLSPYFNPPLVGTGDSFLTLPTPVRPFNFIYCPPHVLDPAAPLSVFNWCHDNSVGCWCWLLRTGTAGSMTKRCYSCTRRWSSISTTRNSELSTRSIHTFTL